MTKIRLNSILGFVPDGQSCPLLWDLRDPPSEAAQPVSSLKYKPPTTKHQLPHAQLATTPPVTALEVTCDIFPYQWRIEARNKHGVTVRDVLTAIYNVANEPLRNNEWAGLTHKQQERISRVYDIRWRGAVHPEKERAKGVRRVDCLLHHTRFAGITMKPGHDFACIMTLARNLKW